MWFRPAQTILLSKNGLYRVIPHHLPTALVPVLWDFWLSPVVQRFQEPCRPLESRTLVSSSPGQDLSWESRAILQHRLFGVSSGFGRPLASASFHHVPDAGDSRATSVFSLRSSFLHRVAFPTFHDPRDGPDPRTCRPGSTVTLESRCNAPLVGGDPVTPPFAITLAGGTDECK